MKKLILIVLCLAAMTGAAAAADEPLQEFDPQQMTQGLPAETRRSLEQVDPDDLQLGGDLAAVLESQLPEANAYLKSALLQSGQLLAVVLLCALAASVGTSRLPDAATLAGTLAIAAISLVSLRQLQQQGSDALSQLQSFSDLLLPAISMAMASGGAVATASALYAATSFVISLMIRLITGLFQPMVYIYMALACADAAVQAASLTRLKDLIGWLISAGLKLILFVFSVYLSLTGVISGSADAATVKAAKLTLSGVVPVVGSMLSDASETLVLSASTLRSSIGVFGMIVVFAICLLPFLQAGIRYLVLKFTAAIGGIFGQKIHTEFLSSICTATGYLLAMTGVCALMLVISFVCYIKAVNVSWS